MNIITLLHRFLDSFKKEEPSTAEHNARMIDAHTVEIVALQAQISELNVLIREVIDNNATLTAMVDPMHATHNNDQVRLSLLSDLAHHFSQRINHLSSRSAPDLTSVTLTDIQISEAASQAALNLRHRDAIRGLTEQPVSEQIWPPDDLQAIEPIVLPNLYSSAGTREDSQERKIEPSL